jgi:SAM-dependent methyltransferase
MAWSKTHSFTSIATQAVAGTGRQGAVAYDHQYYQNNGQSGDRPALWFYARLIRHLMPEGPILDFGCGTGYLMRRLSNWTPTDGFEISNFAREGAQRMLPGSHFYSELEDLPSQRYGGIVSLHVLEHIDDENLIKIFERWKRAVRPGGRFFVVMPDIGGRGRSLKEEKWIGFQDPTHINLKTADQWIDFISHAGLTIERSGSDGLWDFPYRGRSKAIDAMRRGWKTIAQMLAARIIIHPGEGESIILFGRF